MSRVICQKRNFRLIFLAALLSVFSSSLRSDMPSSSTHVPCGSGQTPACTKAGVHPCETPGVALCDDCAQLNPMASALRKIQVERAHQFQIGAGGPGGLAYGAPTGTTECHWWLPEWRVCDSRLSSHPYFVGCPFR
jgi:hypothetical protein